MNYESTAEIEAPAEVVRAWESRSPGLRAVGDHALTRLGDRRSLARLAIDQTGPAVPLARLLYGRLIRRYLALESAGLERRCEQS